MLQITYQINGSCLTPFIDLFILHREDQRPRYWGELSNLAVEVQWQLEIDMELLLDNHCAIHIHPCPLVKFSELTISIYSSKNIHFIAVKDEGASKLTFSWARIISLKRANMPIYSYVEDHCGYNNSLWIRFYAMLIWWDNLWLKKNYQLWWTRWEFMQ